MNSPIWTTEWQLTEGEGIMDGEIGKEGQTYGDRWKPNFWWSACFSVYRY